MERDDLTQFPALERALINVMADDLTIDQVNAGNTAAVLVAKRWPSGSVTQVIDAVEAEVRLCASGIGKVALASAVSLAALSGPALAASGAGAEEGWSTFTLILGSMFAFSIGTMAGFILAGIMVITKEADESSDRLPLAKGDGFPFAGCSFSGQPLRCKVCGAGWETTVCLGRVRQ